MNKRCMGCMEIYSDEFDICPHCGYMDGTPADEAIHMQPGTLLNDRYIVGKVLGFGGFGVTYLGWDGRLEQKVAIKEYLPSEFSTRMPGQSYVSVFSGDKKEQFQDGLNKFVDEAKRLAKFQNEPGIVKIFDSFTENGTAYIIMEFLDGETLTSRLKREKRIPEDEAVKMIWPVLESLQVVHAEGIIHRDIAPDNIFLTKEGEVKLIDFGASRFATTSHSRSLTVIIKPGYSPEEQYRSRGDQGPHTDVYAMAAVLYKMITGKTPPDAMERRAKIETQKRDILEEPHKIIKEISQNRENAILNAMNVQVEDRTADVPSFMQELNAEPPAKRRYGKIKKIDLYTWPLWLKILVPLLLAVFLAVGLLLGTGVISFKTLFSSEVKIPDKMVAVPDVELMDKDEAVSKLESLNITTSTAGNVESEYIEAGKVVLQSPNAGFYVYEYGTVYLTISSGKGVEAAVEGMATVPYVIWDTKDAAIEKLVAAGLAEPEIVEKYDDTVEAGKVIDQSVEYGTKVKEGTKITITVSLGAETFTMPNTKNMTQESAVQLLEGLGLNVKIAYSESNEVEAGKVISQSINAGTEVKAGENVTLTVSTGAVVEETTTIEVAEIETTHKHTYVSEITVEPGVGTPGIRTYTCSTCGHTYTEEIAAYTLSGWVKASKVPSGAEIYDTKWTYDLTSYTTSSSPSMSGWTKYDESHTWTDWGGWSDWQDGYVEGSDYRQIDTQSVPDSYYMFSYVVGINGVRNYASYVPDGSTYRAFHEFTWSADTFNNATIWPQGSWFSDWNPSGEGRIYGAGNAYSSGDVPVYVGNINYKTQYRYRDRTQINTYYFKKTERMESATDPTGQSDVSNVVKYVRYVIK